MIDLGCEKAFLKIRAFSLVVYAFPTGRKVPDRSSRDQVLCIDSVASWSLQEQKTLQRLKGELIEERKSDFSMSYSTRPVKTSRSCVSARMERENGTCRLAF